MEEGKVEEGKVEEGKVEEGKVEEGERGRTSSSRALLLLLLPTVVRTGTRRMPVAVRIVLLQCLYIGCSRWNAPPPAAY